MAILITGGTGFLGRHLTRHLVQSGESVVILDTVPNRQVVADVADQVKVLQGDVMEVTALMDVIQRNKIEGDYSPRLLSGDRRHPQSAAVD